MTADGPSRKRLAGEVAALIALGVTGVYLAGAVSEGAIGFLALALVGIVAAVVVADVVRGLVGSGDSRRDPTEDQRSEG